MELNASGTPECNASASFMMSCKLEQRKHTQLNLAVYNFINWQYSSDNKFPMLNTLRKFIEKHYCYELVSD